MWASEQPWCDRDNMFTIAGARSGKQFMKTHLADPVHAEAMIKTNHREGTRPLGKPYVPPQQFMPKLLGYTMIYFSIWL